MSKTTAKQANDTLARLTKAMARNTELTRPVAAEEVSVPRVEITRATVAPQARTNQAPKPAAVAPSVATVAPRKATGLRLKADEERRIHEVMQEGLRQQQALTVSDVLRIALMEFRPERLSVSMIEALRAKDGRVVRFKNSNTVV